MTAPQKDIVYIDVDDDITAIIGKLKGAEHKIVALVPPKRIGVLQSAVNLRLLARAADTGGKRLVIITNNPALSSLAASAAIPVARNLQSKPELAEIAALDIDDGDEIIDGADLPIGEHARLGLAGEEAAKTTALGAAALADSEPASAAATTKKASPSAKTGSKKVPNFDRFRKKMILIVVGSILLLSFLIWAIFFAGNARVILSIRTIDAAVSQQVTLGTGLETSAKKSTIKAEKKQSTEEVSIDFAATGKKDVGEKATGSVTFSNDSASALFRGIDIPAGTTLTSSSGAVYTTNDSVQLNLSNLGNASTGITAKDRGAKYNGASGNMSGGPSGVDASLDGSTSGGTDKTITIVTKSDVDSASQKIKGEIDSDSAKSTLTKQLGDTYAVVDESFDVNTSDIKPNVAIGQEAAGGKAQLAGTVKYSIYAVTEAELESYLDAVVAQQLDDSDQQKVYEDGAAEATFTNIERNDQGISVTLSTNGKIGPKIDEARVKDVAKGKGYGDIQSELESINGVESVDIKFSPFWVSKAPKNIDKISVEFKLNE